MDYARYTYSKWIQARAHNFLSDQNNYFRQDVNSGLNIVFFGDSHCDFISRDLEVWIDDQLVKIDCFWHGPITAYRVIRDGLKTLFTSTFFEKNLILCPCFGEIDLRMHWCKHTIPSEAFDYSMLFTSKYCERVLELKSQLMSDGLKRCSIILVCPPPPRRKVFLEPGGDFFPVASDTERLVFHHCFRDSLKHFALRHSFGCLDVSSISADQSGYLADKYSDNNVHVVGLDKEISVLLKQQILSL